MILNINWLVQLTLVQAVRDENYTQKSDEDINYTQKNDEDINYTQNEWKR